MGVFAKSERQLNFDDRLTKTYQTLSFLMENSRYNDLRLEKKTADLIMNLNVRKHEGVDEYKLPIRNKNCCANGSATKGIAKLWYSNGNNESDSSTSKGKHGSKSQNTCSEDGETTMPTYQDELNLKLYNTSECKCKQIFTHVCKREVQHLGSSDSRGSLPKNSSQTTSRSLAHSAYPVAEPYVGRNATTRSVSESLMSSVGRKVTRRKRKARRRSFIPEYQQFQDSQVISWLQNKDAQKRQAEKKKRAEERARRAAESAVEMERKRRAEKASAAYSSWLLRKIRDAEQKKQASSKTSLGSTTENKSPTSSQQGDTVTQSPDKVVAQPETDTSERSENIIDKTGKISTIPERPQTPMPNLKEGSLKYAAQKQASSSGKKSPRPESLPNSPTVVATSRSSLDLQLSTAHANIISPTESEQQSSTEHVGRARMTYMDWLKQKFYEAELVKQARREARERLAMLDQLDPKLIDAWAEVLKSRCLEIDKRQNSRNSLGSARVPPLRRLQNRSKQERPSLSDSDVVSTQSLGSYGTNLISRRRRFYLKLPSPTVELMTNRRPRTAFECFDREYDTWLNEGMHPRNAVTYNTVEFCNDASIESTSSWLNTMIDSNISELRLQPTTMGTAQES